MDILGQQTNGTFKTFDCPSFDTNFGIIESFWKYQNQPTNHLIDTENELSTNFDMNGQEVYGSCGVTFKNNYYIFGGQYTSMRILQVSACYLINIGSLGFYSSLGASGSNEDVMVLCFGSGDMKSCRKASSPNGTWTEMALSTYEHRFTAIAASPGN